MRIRHPKDFLTGVMFVGFGAAAMASSFGLAIGSSAKMGRGISRSCSAGSWSCSGP
jgi:hypothetical protein